MDRWLEARFLFKKGSIASRQALCDLLGDFLIQKGVNGLEEIATPKRIQGIRFFPPKGTQGKKIIRLLEREIQNKIAFFPDVAFHPVKVQALRDLSWRTHWQKFSKPIHIAKNFWILPKGCKKPKNISQKSIILHIDPEMAFGTGSHATTRLCLKCLYRLSQEKNLRTCLDWGTGSGILAIAAYRLGILQITAIDIDPDALTVAKRNAKKHQIPRGRGKTKGIQFMAGNISATRKSFDLILANIHTPTLIENVFRIKRRLRKNGRAVLSGILQSQKQETIKALRKNAFSIRDIYIWRGWITLWVSLNNKR